MERQFRGVGGRLGVAFSLYQKDLWIRGVNNRYEQNVSNRFMAKLLLKIPKMLYLN